MLDLANALLPFFLLITTGYILTRTGGINPNDEKTINTIVYWIALPLLFFKTGVIFDLDLLIDTAFPMSILGAQFLTFSFIILVATWFFPGKITHLALHTIHAVGSNTLSYGVPLLYLLFGEDILPPLVIAILLMQIPVIFLGALVAEHEVRQRLWTAPFLAFFHAILNPFWVMFAIGLLFNIFNVPMPNAVTHIMDIGSNMAVGLCLLFIGTQLMIPPTLSSAGEVGWIVLAKLIIHPLCAWIIVTYVLSMDPILSALVVITASLPVGNVFLQLSQKYGAFLLRSETASWVSLLLSFVTVPPIIYYYISLMYT